MGEIMKNKKEKVFKENFIRGLATAIGMMLVFGLSFGAYAYWQNTQSYTFEGAVVSGIDDNSVKSEAQERFHLITPERKANFYINVNTTDNESYNIGMFELDYVTKVNPEHPQEFIVDVIYKVPENWKITEASDENVGFKELLRNPPIQKEVRRDPTFYRGKDYSENIPFNEIEITTDFVYKYTDTNETEYNFIVRVREEGDEMNIANVELIVPEKYEVRVEK